MLLWNLFLRNNEVILYDSVQVVTFSFCMWPFTAVCVCVSDNQWQMKGKKKTALLTLTVREAWLWYGMKLFCWVSVYSEQPVVLKLWMTMGGKKNWDYAKSMIFTENKQKKSTVILFRYSAVYNWNLSLYLHLTLSLASFTTAMNPHWSPFLFLLPRSTIFIILCPTDLLLSPLNVSKPSHPQLSTFSVRAVPLLHSFL